MEDEESTGSPGPLLNRLTLADAGQIRVPSLPGVIFSCFPTGKKLIKLYNPKKRKRVGGGVIVNVPPEHCLAFPSETDKGG